MSNFIEHAKRLIRYQKELRLGRMNGTLGRMTPKKKPYNE